MVPYNDPQYAPRFTRASASFPVSRFSTGSSCSFKAVRDALFFSGSAHFSKASTSDANQARSSDLGGSNGRPHCTESAKTSFRISSLAIT